MSAAIAVQPGQSQSVPGAGAGQNRVAGTGSSTPTARPGTGTGGLAEFEGCLKRAGHTAGVVLSEIVRYAIPLASVVAAADPLAAPATAAFVTSLKLVQSTVIASQQRWVGEGSAANAKKLADVLEVVEQPIILMFSQAGVSVDAAYVTNLVNGVGAIVNAQPSGSVAPAA